MSRENTNLRAELEERLRFETLIADLSSKFVSLPAGDVNREIMDAERRICEVLDLDVSAIWQWSAGPPGFFTLTHYYSAQDGPQPSMRLSETDFPWFRQLMLEGRIVPISSLDEMPAEAAIDRENARRLGIKSNLCLPLMVGGQPPVGILGLNTTRAERAWPDALVKRLQLLAQVFTNALARSRADQALRESEERLSLAAEFAEAGLWVLDCHTQVFWATAKARMSFGYSPDEVINMERFKASVHPDDWDLVRGSLERSLQAGDPVNLEYRIRLDDGGERWIASRGRPFFNSTGEPERLLGLSMDITERKQTEAEVLRQRVELAHVARVSTMGELAASVAHELNQPLGAILANAEAGELFLEQNPPALDELRAILVDIRKDDERAGQVIRRMRALLRKRELERLPLEINSLVQDVLQLVSGDAALRGVALTADLGPVLPKVDGDRVHLQQVLLNLILNGMDAMAGQPRERRRIRVRTRLGAEGRVELAVIDSGHGLEPAKLPRLFDPFYTTKPNGMGMGLSISRKIIEAHHGRIWAEDNASGGAVFRIELPASDD